MAALPSYAEIRARQAQPCMLRHGSGQATDDRPIAALLAEVDERREGGGCEQFSLFFSATEPGQPRQGIHTVTFADAAIWEVFLVPVRRDGEQVVYEACFNRMLAPDVA